MTANYHTDIATGAAANASIVNSPLGQLDQAITDLHGGAAVEDDTLKEWTEGEDYELTAINRDSDGVITTATVKWPDGSGGTFTTTSKNSTWLAIDAYTISHTVSGKTVTQAAVTRNSSGDVTVKPALTVA
ncbi:MAG: hypothetical protein A2136_05440 [Chloroflexi bacterium RBG_16_54_11]|nr:MAG: hypothetical protein A2136_05440 [Chloroflexi bacterium RBG_16_54_11]